MKVVRVTLAIAVATLGFAGIVTCGDSDGAVNPPFFDGATWSIDARDGPATGDGDVLDGSSDGASAVPPTIVRGGPCVEEMQCGVVDDFGRMQRCRCIQNAWHCADIIVPENQAYYDALTDSFPRTLDDLEGDAGTRCQAADACDVPSSSCGILCGCGLAGWQCKRLLADGGAETTSPTAEATNPSADCDPHLSVCNPTASPCSQDALGQRCFTTTCPTQTSTCEVGDAGIPEWSTPQDAKYFSNIECGYREL